MAYDELLAERVRQYLHHRPHLLIQEKRMFGGLAFMINNKMCVNISGDNLMCRFDPALESEIARRSGYLEVNMKGKPMRGYCYVSPEGFLADADFKFWIELCLDFNDRAKSSKK